jgi:hypothetical protein
MCDAVNTLRDLRVDLLDTEIRRRWAARRLDVDGYIGLCAEVKSIENAIFNLEARLLSQEKRNELLATRPKARGLGEGNAPIQ